MGHPLGAPYLQTSGAMTLQRRCSQKEVMHLQNAAQAAAAEAETTEGVSRSRFGLHHRAPKTSKQGSSAVGPQLAERITFVAVSAKLEMFCADHLSVVSAAVAGHLLCDRHAYTLSMSKLNCSMSLPRVSISKFAFQHPN